MIIEILAIIGFFLSAYYLFLRHKLKSGHKPLCDISENVSCSKAIESKHSTIFIVPNALLGLLYYIAIFGLTYVNMTYVFYLSIPASLFSLYLIFISIKMRNLCVVCLAVNIINFLITGLSV